jgi:DNA mismatch repair protein MutS2
MEVFAGENRRRGKIVRPDKKGPAAGKAGTAGNTWIVEIGSLKMSFPESDLIPAPRSLLKPHIAEVSLAPTSAALPELNLRGLRLIEALESLRRQTDAALLSGLKSFSVIHGTGDGVLQRAVHGWLKEESSVADYYFARPELGGFGRTEVMLK